MALRPGGTEVEQAMVVILVVVEAALTCVLPAIL